MGIEHHLLALTRIGTHEQHAAVTEPDMSHLHRDGDAIDEHDLMAPVELVSLARGKRQRHIGLSRHCSAFLAPALGIAPNRIVAAVIAGTTQLFVNPRQCQPFTAGLRLVRQENRIQLLAPWTDLRQWLVLALIVELCRPRPDDFANHFPRQAQLTADRLDGFALTKKRSTYLCNRLHNQHSKPASIIPGGTLDPQTAGVPLGCRSPR